MNIGGGGSAKSLAKKVDLLSDVDFAKSLSEYFVEKNIDVSRLLIETEPGRRLVEDHGYLITRVIAKKTRNDRNILIVDSGTNFVRSIRNWHHNVTFLKPLSEEKNVKYDIYGSNCFESDIFIRGISGPLDVNSNIYIIVGQAGGYDIPSANMWIRSLPKILGIYDNRLFLVRDVFHHSQFRLNEKKISW